MTKKFGFSFDEENSLPDITPSQKEEFVRGATTHAENTKKEKNLDRKAKPTYGINLRFNEYQMDLIRKVCEQEERSQQYVLKRIIIPVLEEMRGKIR